MDLNFNQPAFTLSPKTDAFALEQMLQFHTENLKVTRTAALTAKQAQVFVSLMASIMHGCVVQKTDFSRGVNAKLLPTKTDALDAMVAERQKLVEGRSETNASSAGSSRGKFAAPPAPTDAFTPAYGGAPLTQPEAFVQMKNGLVQAFGAGILTLQNCKVLTDFVTRGFFAHFNLYQYCLRDECTRDVERVKTVSDAGPGLALASKLSIAGEGGSGSSGNLDFSSVAEPGCIARSRHISASEAKKYVFCIFNSLKARAF